MRIAIDSSSQEDRVAALTLAELIMEGNKQGFEKRVLAFIQLSQYKTDVITSSYSAVSSQVVAKERSQEKNERLVQRQARHPTQESWYAMSQHVLM